MELIVRNFCNFYLRKKISLLPSNPEPIGITKIIVHCVSSDETRRFQTRVKLQNLTSLEV